MLFLCKLVDTCTNKPCKTPGNFLHYYMDWDNMDYLKMRSKNSFIKVHMKNVCDSVSKSTWPLLVNFQKIGNRYFFQELKAWPNLVVWRKNIRIFCENRYTSSKRNISRGWAREVRLAHSQIWMSHITLNGHIFKTDNLVKRSLI